MVPVQFIIGVLSGAILGPRGDEAINAIVKAMASWGPIPRHV